jgi:hypothetical protein
MSRPKRAACGDVLRIDFRDGAVDIAAGEMFVVAKGGARTAQNDVRI